MDRLSVRCIATFALASLLMSTAAATAQPEDVCDVKVENRNATVLCLATNPLSDAAVQGKEFRTKLGVTAGKGGNEFSDKPLPEGARVIGVKIWHGALVDGVELLYKTAGGKHEALEHHGGNGGAETTFMLNDGEYIKGIEGTSNDDFLVSMTIVTNKRKSDVFGAGMGAGKHQYSFIATGGEVVGFYGHAAACVVNIGIWVHKK
jgi:hypothetical protein